MAHDPTAPDPERIATQQDFGRELAALRARAGLTVREAARAAGIPVSTTGDYFSGRHLPADRQQLARILRACGETDPARLARWAAALQRARRPPGKRMDTPYRGLARFEREDARWFFGREDVTSRLAAMAAAEATEPIVLAGPSGAGKSSLLRAGLLPRLDPAGPVVVFEPGGTPLDDLKAHLTEADGDGRPTVIVDQFEAVFTLCADEAQRREFIAAICDLARTALVIVALRADFYDHAIRYPGLASALQARQVVLGAMTEEQVRRTITEPARLARVDVEDGLIALLLADLAPPGGEQGAAHGGGAYEPGALPLLSHAMLATWDRGHGGTLTVADYLASGGIRDALTQTAERAYAALPAQRQRLARRLFLRLVHVADDLPPSRATAALGELRDTTGADAWEVLATFVRERLITVDADTVQITHDALLTAWPRLRSWIDSGAEGLRVRRRITDAARAWQDAGRENAALWRGSQLAIAREWAADEDNRASLSTLTAEFVSASAAEASARERAQRRRTRRLKAIAATLSALVVAVCLLAGYAFKQREVAASASDDANSRELAVEAGQVRGENEPLAAQLSVAAYGIARTPQATASLLESSGSPSAARILDSSGIVQWAAISPDRRLLAAAGADGTLRLWNVASPGHPVLVSTVLRADSAHPLYTAAFSPDGKTLAAAGAGRVVMLWNVANPSRPAPLGQLTGPANTVYSIAFSPDGRLLAAASADDTVRLWNVTDPARARPAGALTGPTGYAETVAFSPDGTVLAAGSGNATPGSADDSVWLWNIANPAHPVPFPGMPLTGPASIVSGVAFSPDGHTLAASSEDHKVWLWKVSGGRAAPDGTLAGAASWANAVAFSPDGTALAAGTSDASVLVWNLATRALTATLPQSQPVTSVSWDGTDRIAASDADGTVSLWSVPTPVLLTGNAADSVAYSPDGTTIAVGGQSVQIWNAARRALTATLPLPEGTIVNGLAYSPDGDTIAVAYNDGTAQLLDARTLRPASAPFRVTATGNAETVAFSPEGGILATGGDDGTVRLWSVANPARPRWLSTIRDSGTYVYTVVFAPGGKTLAAASVDDLTRLWNVASPARPVLLGKPLGGLASYAIGLAFSPDGETLAIGSADKTVRLWNVSDLARPAPAGAPQTGPAGYVWAVAFSPDGRTLAAGATDGTVWLWSVADPAQPSLIATLTGPNGHVYSLAFSPSGGELAASSDDGTIHLWDSSPAAAQAGVCASLGQPLTRQEWATYVPGVPYRAPCS
jgi:WD40 repeat protein/transcriptional regulator with XRE-family HTH domain